MKFCGLVVYVNESQLAEHVGAFVALGRNAQRFLTRKREGFALETPYESVP
jgi:hypothetical protein